MKNTIKYFAIAAMMLLGMNASAQTTIFQWVINSNSTNKGTYNASGGNAVVSGSNFSTGTTDIITVGTESFYKMNSSTKVACSLSSETYAAGDTIILHTVCGSAKSSAGFKINGQDITSAYEAKKPIDLKRIVVANDGIAGANTFEISRINSDARFYSVTVIRPSSQTGGEQQGGEQQGGEQQGGEQQGGEQQGGEQQGGEQQGGEQQGGEQQGGEQQGGEQQGGTGTVPQTTLTLHEPEVYEAPLADGGYNTALTTFSSREYEVYYAAYNATNSNYQVATYVGRKQTCITETTTDNYSCKATDGWLEVHSSTSKSDMDIVAKDEFDGGKGTRHSLLKDGYYELHIKGYDQFSFYGKDNSTTISKNQRFQVYIDGVLQPETQVANAATIRRYNITPTEHLIKVVGIGSGNNEFYGFSLRVADVPKMKFVAGDTAQTAQQARAIEPVTYYHKNKKAAAELSWVGAAIPGISLQEGTNDTLYLQGTADAQCGSYRYVIAAKQNGEVVSTQTGTITIRTGIHATFGNTGTANAYEDNVMDNIVWNYDALSTDSVLCTWDNGNEPDGLTFTKDQTTLTLTLGGTPTSVGTYTYTLICGDTIHGTVIVRSTSATIVPGATHTILYLNKEYDNAGDHIFAYLKTEYNYLVRPATDVMADAAQYNKYDVIVISEDVDATSGEVLSIIRTLAKPVLNMKAFTYSSSRLGWGDPNNGSISNTSIDIMQPGHPVFTSPYPLTGSNIEIISAVGDNKRGIMCADITLQGSFALASAPKRGDDYFSDGENAVFLHEVPAAMHNNAKYLLLPIATGATLTENGKKLINNCIEYLCSTQQSTIVLPTLRIEVFQINGVSGVIDHKKKTIDVNLPYGTDITALTPVITVSDPQATFISPADGETVDFSDTHYGVNYTLSDGINKVVYTVKVHVATALEEISGYVPGEWVNIYDVQGHLITTTNEDVRTMDLQRGLYLIVTESGVTTKLLRN